MKALSAILFLFSMLSCSAPTYVYDFGQPPAVTSQNRYAAPAPSTPAPEQSQTTMTLTASSESHPASEKQAPRFSHKQARTPEPEVKQAVSEKPNQAKPVRFEGDLKRFTFFVVGGVILLVLGSDTLVVLGSLCLIIGAIFGIKWFLNR